MIKHKNLMKFKMLAAACACTIAVSPAAFSVADARTVTGVISQIPVETIDVNRSITLTLQMTGPNPFDETQPGQLPHGPMGGHTVTLSLVSGVDLTTSQGWEKAQKMSVEEARKAGLRKVASEITNDEGRVMFTGLSVGLYLVEETVPADASQSYVAVLPFLLTLPIGSDGAWDYDVEILAKTGDVPPGTTEPSTPPKTPVPEVPGPSDEPTPTPSVPVVTPPSEPDQPPVEPPTSSGRDRLAMTGVSVLGIIIAGIGLMLWGGFLVRFPRRNQK